MFDVRFEEVEIQEIGDRVVASGEASIVGRGGGVDLRTPLAIVITRENGLVIRGEQFLSH